MKNFLIIALCFVTVSLESAHKTKIVKLVQLRSQWELYANLSALIFGNFNFHDFVETSGIAYKLGGMEAHPDSIMPYIEERLQWYNTSNQLKLSPNMRATLKGMILSCIYQDYPDILDELFVTPASQQAAQDAQLIQLPSAYVIQARLSVLTHDSFDFCAFLGNSSLANEVGNQIVEAVSLAVCVHRNLEEYNACKTGLAKLNNRQIQDVREKIIRELKGMDVTSNTPYHNKVRLPSAEEVNKRLVRVSLGNLAFKALIEQHVLAERELSPVDVFMRISKIVGDTGLGISDPVMKIDIVQKIIGCILQDLPEALAELKKYHVITE